MFSRDAVDGNASPTPRDCPSLRQALIPAAAGRKPASQPTVKPETRQLSFVRLTGDEFEADSITFSAEGADRPERFTDRSVSDYTEWQSVIGATLPFQLREQSRRGMALLSHRIRSVRERRIPIFGGPIVIEVSTRWSSAHGRFRLGDVIVIASRARARTTIGSENPAPVPEAEIPLPILTA
jgi:hypothetical protein